MDSFAIQDLVSELTDLELAILLALICQEHCVIETPIVNVDNVAGELALICQNRFGLSYAILDCSPATSIDEFSNSILVSDANRGRLSNALPSFQTGGNLDERKIVNVVIAKNLDQVSSDLQIQTLELIRSKRIFTRTSIHTAQKTFLFIPVIGYNDTSRHGIRLNKHLNEFFLFSHFHEIGAGLPNLEGDDGWPTDDQASLSSIVRKPQPYSDHFQTYHRQIPEEAILQLRLLSNAVSVSAEVNRYLHNIVAFLRLNRAVAGGMSAKATKYFMVVAKSLASLHGIDYLTPSVVCLAAKKVYRHRIVVARPEDDRSLQYGSHLSSVAMLLKGVDPDQIINSVISEIEVPL
ncbi:hypothetical protein TMatcc_003076 [Talaromyces marneffei ATCC 18224]|uniref:magnesium chelatase n=2 Tax=Talaromyces marneffei TaxID=37727 RepID=B6Q6A6_TALMQ|nr:uncharacterized protein EYB26_001861 [Talaromyces marneffei]EEA28581.1 conserved hypothetical protein [Talaromyces marneffei ATCC 18224]KAE8555797.1 hypothetical protein EYB25_000495 [Talaromyces marneffei]QGA14208.1 hypothetical protein EYB26_001861 [Talaromyces marneffei]